MSFSTIVEKMFEPKGYKPEGAAKKKNPWQNVRLKNKSASVKEDYEAQNDAKTSDPGEYVGRGSKNKKPMDVWGGYGSKENQDRARKNMEEARKKRDGVKESDDTGMQGFLDKAKKPEQIKKIQNHIDHVKDMLRKAPADDKTKLSATLAGLKADLKKAQVSETVEDADHHIQRAHDSLVSAITKNKRQGKDCSKLEKIKASLASHLEEITKE